MATPNPAPTQVRRRLGRTDVEITPIGLGVMEFAGGRGMFRWVHHAISSQTMTEIVDAALTAGINWFDTAEIYGNGYAERSLSRALRDLGRSDSEVVIATKWWPLFRTARSIRRTFGERQRNLEGYTIDLYQIHRPLSFSSIGAQMGAMAELLKAGKIRAIGVSNFNALQMRRAYAVLAQQHLALASNQVQYNLLHRHIEANGVLEAAKSLHMTIISWSPLASGLLTGKFHRQPELLQRTPIGRRRRFARLIEKTRPLIAILEEVALSHQVSIAQVALNWLINFHGDVVVAIPGASRPEHARQNAGAMSFRLSDEEMARIDLASRQFGAETP